METILIVAVSALNIACFLIGATVGFRVQKGETPIEAPKSNPVKTIREREAKKALQEEQNRMDIILHNVEVYNGTAQGQQDVPRG